MFPRLSTKALRATLDEQPTMAYVAVESDEVFLYVFLILISTAFTTKSPHSALRRTMLKVSVRSPIVALCS